MGEKIYKTMRGAGAWNIALGIVLIIVGVVSGILMIVSGAKLLSDKKNLLF